MSVSVLILTHNEELNLPRCLAAVGWCDDVLVVDSFSDDGTVAIARAAGARVLRRKFDHFAGQRNYGLAQGALRHEWVLHLDADEVVTDALRAEINCAIMSQTLDAYQVASKLMFGDVWLRYSGMYPSYQVRLGRRSVLTFRQVGHGQRETLPASRIGTLREPLIHYAFAKGMAHWQARHEAYAIAEARHAMATKDEPLLERGSIWELLANRTTRRRALKRLSFRLPFRPQLRFVYMYLLRGGFRDGVAGLEYCRLLSRYERMIDVELRQLRRTSDVRTVS